jgi:peptide/nickel transport system substrate-binding protein
MAFSGLLSAPGSSANLLVALALGLMVGVALAAPTATVRLAVPVPMTTFGNPFIADDGSSTRPSLFDGLTQLTREGRMEPALAVGWRMIGPTTWTFDLRPGVKFYNGAPFTAEAVVAAIETLQRDPALFMAREVSGIAGVRALDPLHVEITTRTPDPILPNRLASVMIPEPGALRALGLEGFTMAPVGTGPFRPASWDRSSARARLTAVAESWRPSVDVGTVDMTVLTDATTRLQALLSGQADIAVNLEPDQLETLRAAGLPFHVLPAPHVLAILLRNVGEAAAPLKDARVRRALNLAVDKQIMLDGVLGGHGAIASQITTPGIPGFDETLAPYPYDPDAARRLLAEAGYGDGFALTVGVFSGQVPGDTSIFQLMRQNLAAVGVNVTLRSLSMADFLQRVGTGKWGGVDALPMALSSARFGDARQPIEQLSCDWPTRMFCAPELSDQVAQSNVELDPVRRKTMLQGLVRAMHEIAPVLLLTQYASFTGTQPRVTRYMTRANGVRFDAVEVAD